MRKKELREALEALTKRAGSHSDRLSAVERRLEQTTPAAGGHMLHQRLQVLEDWRAGLDGNLDLDGNLGHEAIRRFVEGLRELPERVDRDHKLVQAHEGQLIDLHRAVKDLREGYNRKLTDLLAAQWAFARRLAALEALVRDGPAAGQLKALEEMHRAQSPSAAAHSHNDPNMPATPRYPDHIDPFKALRDTPIEPEEVRPAVFYREEGRAKARITLGEALGFPEGPKEGR